MKIAYVITRSDAVGGASIHVRDLAQAMLERGHQALVLVGGEGAVTELLAEARIPFRPLRFLRRALDPLRDLRALAELTGCLAELRPDVVSCHTAKAGWLGRAACARLALPVLYTPHGLAAGGRFPFLKRWLFGLAERAAGRWPQSMVCVCESERRLALRARMAPPERLAMIHNGVRDVPLQLRADPAREPVRIVSVARMDAPKDHRTLLEALAALHSTRWQLDLVGDGPRWPEVRDLAAELGIGRRVRMLGYLRDPAWALARAQVFVLSSRSEAFPRSVLEALRAGLPVVASEVGGVREAVTHGVNGLLVPPADPVALAAALGRLIGDAALRRSLGERARAAYEAHFRLERMVEETAALYRAVEAGSLCPAGSTSA